MTTNRHGAYCLCLIIGSTSLDFHLHMTIEKMIASNIFHIVNNDIYSIRKFIDSVFDDGDWSDKRSEYADSDLEKEPRDIDDLGIECPPAENNCIKSKDETFCINIYENVPQEFICEGNIQTETCSEEYARGSENIGNICNKSVHLDDTRNEQKGLLLRSEKVKFSLKTPRAVLLKQSQMTLDEPEALKVPLFIPNQEKTHLQTRLDDQPIQGIVKVNLSTTCFDISNSSPGGNNEATNNNNNENLLNIRNYGIEKPSKCMSRKRSVSSSSTLSSRYSPKNKYRYLRNKSRSSLSKTKFSSKNHISSNSNKLSKDSSELTSTQFRKRRSRSKSQYSKMYGKQHHRCDRSMSSESERIIAAQFSAPSPQSKSKKLKVMSKRCSGESNEKFISGNEDNISPEMRSKEIILPNYVTGPGETKNDTSRTNVYSQQTWTSFGNSTDNQTYFAFDDWSRGDKDVSSFLDDNGLKVQTGEKSKKVKKFGSIRDKTSSFLDGDDEDLLDVWDLDPLLINSIPTDDDIIITPDKVKEFKKSKVLQNWNKVIKTNNDPACTNETGMGPDSSCTLENEKRILEIEETVISKNTGLVNKSLTSERLFNKMTHHQSGGKEFEEILFTNEASKHPFPKQSNQSDVIENVCSNWQKVGETERELGRKHNTSLNTLAEMISSMTSFEEVLYCCQLASQKAQLLLDTQFAGSLKVKTFVNSLKQITETGINSKIYL